MGLDSRIAIAPSRERIYGRSSVAQAKHSRENSKRQPAAPARSRGLTSNPPARHRTPGWNLDLCQVLILLLQNTLEGFVQVQRLQVNASARRDHNDSLVE